MTPMEHQARANAIPASYAFLAGLVVAIAIFILDTLTYVGMTFSVFYVAVVLIAARFCRARGIALAAAACVALTTLSYILSRGAGEVIAGINYMLALSVIVLTASVVARNRAAEAKTLEAVQALQDQLRLVIDTIPMLVWTKLPDGPVDFLNQRFREYSGLSLEGAGSGWIRAIHPQDRPKFEAEWQAAVASGVPPEIEARLRRADGEYRWFLNRVAPLRDERGRIARWYATTIDIEDRKRAEAVLREQAALLDLSHDTIFVRDANNVITYWNRGAEALYGWSREEALGKVSHHLMQTIFPAPLSEITAELARTARWEGELVHAKRDGTRVTVASRWSLQRDAQGRLAGILETNNDITERKRAEAERAQLQEQLRQAEKMEAIGRFASGIAHDFNNVLGGILAYGEMLFDDAPGDSPRKRYAQNVLIAATRGRELIDQILAYSRRQRGRRAPTDVCRTVVETLELVRSSLPASITLQPIVPDAPMIVMSDATQLHQVAMNLCSNSIQAMSAGGTLRVAITSAEVCAERAVSHGALRSGHYVCLRVDDSGCGMDEATLGRIFEPFFTTKEHGRGTGLGLALVYAIVTDLAGAIDVKSAPAQGTTFSIYLPLVETPAAMKSAEKP
jgi:PAS domain S-box-containing protein